MNFSKFASQGDRHHILGRIILLRALALTTAVLVLLVFQWYLARSLSYELMYTLVALGCVATLVSLVRLRRVPVVDDWELALQLLIDGAILVCLVAFSGRASNPFIYYLLVLVAIASAIFPRWLAWGFGALAVASYTLLLYLDLAAHIHHLFSDFQLHLVGMWINFVGSTALLTFFVSNLATALRDREIRLAKAREQALQSEQLIAIGTLAASTAHALGTPLSTMAIVLGEMPRNDDVGLLQAQVERCKRTLGQLSRIADKEQSREEVVVEELFEELNQHYQLTSPGAVPEFMPGGRAGDLRLRYSPLLAPAIINIIDNALRAARSQVQVRAQSQGGHLQIMVTDDGEGLAPEQALRYGTLELGGAEDGMGIGVFLANTTLEQLGGRIVLHNANDSGGSKTAVAIELPLLD